MIVKIAPLKPGESVPAPLNFYHCSVAAEWVDYNNHMTEAAYLTAFGWASDVLFQYIGINDDYRAAGNSYYTVETHIIYEREADFGDQLRITTQVLDFDSKRLHFNHEMFNADNNERLATCEQMLLHVDSAAAKAAPIPDSVAVALTAIKLSHGRLPVPPEVGRTMKIRRKA
ncbi:MAG: thioesterase family protein [Actinobacteria bacterium]|nr:thioesterase family protein [Actinomycetota bacterium]